MFKHYLFNFSLCNFNKFEIYSFEINFYINWLNSNNIFVQGNIQYVNMFLKFIVKKVNL